MVFSVLSVCAWGLVEIFRVEICRRRKDNMKRRKVRERERVLGGRVSERRQGGWEEGQKLSVCVCVCPRVPWAQCQRKTSRNRH